MAAPPAETDTKQRILDVALGLFSRGGYQGTSVASICSAAGVNVAGVNYHFGSKLELYIEVWKVALARGFDTSPFDEGLPEDATNEDRIRGRVRSLINRFVHPGAPSGLAMLIIHELAEPTDPAVDEVRRRAIEPDHAAMRALVREMLGEGATERDVLFTTMGVFLPVFGLGLQQQSVYRRDSWSSGGGTSGGLPGMVLRDAIEAEGGYEALIEHMTTTTLAGIAAVRERIRRRAGKRGDA